MKKLSIISCMVFGFISLCHGKNFVNFSFESDTINKVAISGPVDGAFNYTNVKKTLEITPGVPAQYNTELNEYCFFQLQFETGRCCVLAFPGDSIKIKYANGLFSFSGANAVGQDYYSRKWGYTGEFFNALTSRIFAADDFSDFQEKFTEEFVKPTQAYIEQMAMSGSITPEFAKALTREIVDCLYYDLFDTMGDTHSNRALTEEQKSQIDLIVKRLANKFATIEDDEVALRHRLAGSRTIQTKYDVKYSELNDTQKKELHGGHKPEAFGPLSYCEYLVAPKNVQMTFFFNALLSDYKYGSMGFEPINAPYVLNYMKTLAPESEAVAILTALENERLAKAASADSIVIQYYDGQVNTLAELAKIPELKGNCILIDLWASWCMPCLMEHQHSRELHDLVATYRDLKQVYITIDEPNAEKRWKSLVKKFELGGVNIMAGKELQKDIIEKIYKNQSISIPRYILLSPLGEVLNADMPRPSDLTKLKTELDKEIGSKIFFIN